MRRQPISSARADGLMFDYARAHNTRILHVDDLARASGLVTPEGRLVYVGARWFLIERQPDLRQFRVALPVHGARTVEVSSRARLAVNLCELGYSAVTAGRVAFRAWSDGLAQTSQGKFVAQEVTA